MCLVLQYSFCDCDCGNIYIKIILTDTDYGNEIFPIGAGILDYLRCSMTFKTPKKLLDGIKRKDVQRCANNSVCNNV